MKTKFFIYPFVAGMVITIAGANIVEQPIKTIFLIAVLCFTHEMTRGEKA